MTSLAARWIIVSAASLAVGSMLGGCASARRGAIAPATSAPTTLAATTAPSAISATAQLRLDEIPPRPVLAKAKAPTTGPTSAPLAAIEFYARARELQLSRLPNQAIQQLQHAIDADPNSFELQFALGKAYLSLGQAELAIQALQRAAEINPNNLDVQTELGRSFQARNELPKAIEHLRLAMQTDDYRTDDSTAAVVDYRLAVSLQQSGYDRAAMECLVRLLYRIEHAGTGIRTAAEISFLMGRPELLFDEIGKLHEKLGEYPQALEQYQRVAQGLPNQFDVQARVVGLLLKMGRNKEAVALSTELLQRFHASGDSINLLRDAFKQSGGSQYAIVDALRKLYRERPNDRSILFALSDTLAANGQLDQARQLLERGIESRRGDVEIVERLFNTYSDRDQVTDAAKLIVTSSAAYPDSTSELLPLLMELTKPARKGSLRLAALQKLEVPASAQAAKQYWIWKIASLNQRPGVAKTALDQSAAAVPLFDPALIVQLESMYAKTEWDDASRERAITELIDSVAAKGRADLAAYLKGLRSLHENKLDQAAENFGQAIKLATPASLSPDLQLAHALSLLRQGNQARFEQLMWKLISDRPRFEAGFQVLFTYFKQNNGDAQASNLVNTWIAADPSSTSARLQQVSELIEQRRVDEAVSAMKKLFEQHPDELDVVRSLISLLGATNQRQQMIDLLEGERNRHPNNRIVVEALIEIYTSQNRPADAARVVDAARAALSQDPELLYYVAHLYQRLDQNQTSEDVLEDVLKLDPKNPQASNDLGYNWADSGKNLDRAEAMIRLAVEAEPDNSAYLDSLGWVLYKRSKFAEALKFLEQACSPQGNADPVVLDHLGDTLYRLNRAQDAASAWKQALSRSSNQDAGDPKSLPLQLQSKIRQAEAGQTVNVAPIVEPAPPAGQVKANP